MAKSRQLSEAVSQHWDEVANHADAPTEVVVPFSINSMHVGSVTDRARLRWWVSDWGAEWEHRQAAAADGLDLSVSTGRSSKGAHPFLVIESDSRCLIVAVAWSGNWCIKVEPRAGELFLTAGLDREVRHLLGAGEAVSAPVVFLAEGRDFNHASAELVSAYRKLHPRRMQMRTEWNHWWPYEDWDISEEVFLRNARVARESGIDTAVLDAGWFGKPDTQWFELRGDWQQQNTNRFPDGTASVASATRAVGIDFGIWMEPEAIGAQAELQATRPDLVARDADGNSLGYICFGAPAARDFAKTMVMQVVSETDAAWLKWDFNVDAGFGCVRTDHGHGPDDGLFSHVTGLYQVLDYVRAARPEMILESCSSGGLRVDLGIAAHVDCMFASDPDWPEHAMTYFWAASHFFPAELLLGWCGSQWRGDHPHQNFAAASNHLREYLDFIHAIAGLGRFGVSQRLADWSADDLGALSGFVSLYNSQLRPRWEAGATLEWLTEQPERLGQGERCCAAIIRAEGFTDLLYLIHLSDPQAWRVEIPVTATAALDLLGGRDCSVQAGKLSLALPPESAAIIELL